MFGHDLPQARVELLSMFVEHHCVRVPVELLKAQATVVLPLNLLDGILQKVPDIVDIFLIHSHLHGEQGNETCNKMTTVLTYYLYNQLKIQESPSYTCRKLFMAFVRFFCNILHITRDCMNLLQIYNISQSSTHNIVVPTLLLRMSIE